MSVARGVEWAVTAPLALTLDAALIPLLGSCASSMSSVGSLAWGGVSG